MPSTVFSSKGFRGFQCLETLVGRNRILATKGTCIAVHASPKRSSYGVFLASDAGPPVPPPRGCMFSRGTPMYHGMMPVLMRHAGLSQFQCCPKFHFLHLSLGD